MVFVLYFAALIDMLAPAGTHIPYRTHFDVPFKQTVEGAIRLDLFLPEGATGPAPAVVILHGGGWNASNKTDYRDMAVALARHGIAAAAMDFRATPPDGFDGQVADIKDGIRWLRAHAADYGIDPDRLGLFGSSSGGHLAALVGMAGNGEGLGDDPPGTSSAVQAAFYLYGIYDLRPPVSFLIEVPAALYLHGNIHEAPDRWSLFSPVTHIDGSEPRTLLVHGADDWFVPIGRVRELRDGLAEAGVAVTLAEVPDMGHGFFKIRPWLRPFLFLTMRTYFQSSL